MTERPPLPDDLWAFLIGYFILLPFFLAPLILTRFLPGLDLPFHLALAELLSREGGAYKDIYDAGLGLAPYLLHYGLLYGLSSVLPVAAAHKLVMALYVSALPLSAARLLGVCRRSRLPALLCFPLCYNMPFFHGFIGFVLSLPVLFFLLAQVADNLDEDHEDESVAWPLVRDVLLAALFAILFFSHLETYAFGVLCGLVFIASGEASMTARIRTSLCLIPSLVLCGLWLVRSRPGAGGEQDSIGLSNVLHLLIDERIKDLESGGVVDTGPVLADLLARVEVFPQHLLLGFKGGLHISGTLVLVVLFLFFFVMGTLSIFARERDGAMARMRAAGVLGVLLALLFYFGLPHHLRRLEVMTVYPRFAVIIAVLALLLMPGWLRRPRRPLQIALMIPCLSGCLWFGSEMARRFYAFGEEIADFAEVLDKTPPGGRAVGLVFERGSKVLDVGSALVGLPSYYPVERPSPDSLIGQPYCGMRHMPCRVRVADLLPPDPGPFSADRFDPQRAVPYFDYFITRAAPPPRKLFGRLSGEVTVIAKAGAWIVYGKRRGEAAEGGASDKAGALPASSEAARVKPMEPAAPSSKEKRRRKMRRRTPAVIQDDDRP